MSPFFYYYRPGNATLVFVALLLSFQAFSITKPLPTKYIIVANGSPTAGNELKKKSRNKKIVIAYVGGYNGREIMDSIDVKKIDIINYAFVDVFNGEAWLHNERTDTVNFRKLNLLKAVKPGLKIVISIGGWSWSGRFSDAVISDSSRKVFARSAASIVARYDLDGIDIDWEYPAAPGDSGNVYRPEDKQNYTLMFKEIRSSLNSLAALTHCKYIVTTAVEASASYIKNTEILKVAQYTDYLNLMSYDFSEGSIASHHTNLYPSTDYSRNESAHKAVRDFLEAGVPPGKIVLGIAMYGKGWVVSGSDKKLHGLHQPLEKISRNEGYSFIKDSLINQKGFVQYWDKQAKAHYLFNKATRQFITYDSERSVREKCRYVNQNDLGGVMFWEYAEDRKLYLLSQIDRSLKKN